MKLLIFEFAVDLYLALMLGFVLFLGGGDEEMPPVAFMGDLSLGLCDTT